MIELSVQDRVCKKHGSYYPTLNLSGRCIAPIGTHGTIMRVRKRYEHTPHFYILYVVKFDGYDYTDDLIDQYESHALTYCVST